jgi:anti-anti-sigma regulatory factor
MLMIKRIEANDAMPVLKLEGKLKGPWVEVLRNVCEEGSSSSDRLRLDLAAVTFVDAAGLDYLKELLRGGIAIVASSGFVAASLELDAP